MQDLASQKASCGQHLNDWYDFDASKSGYVYDCKKESASCKCTDDGKDRCEFYVGYLEGSSYSGFMVLD
jgi:hypothetical protein